MINIDCICQCGSTELPRHYERYFENHRHPQGGGHPSLFPFKTTLTFYKSGRMRNVRKDLDQRFERQ